MSIQRVSTEIIMFKEFSMIKVVSLKGDEHDF